MRRNKRIWIRSILRIRVVYPKDDLLTDGFLIIIMSIKLIKSLNNILIG